MAAFAGGHCQVPLLVYDNNVVHIHRLLEGDNQCQEFADWFTTSDQMRVVL